MAELTTTATGDATRYFISLLHLHRMRHHANRGSTVSSQTPEDYYSDEALAKQAALDALPEGELAPWSMLLGILEPRIEPTAAERCTCCGLDARDAEGGRERRGKRWCFICLGRGHDEEDDQ